MNFAEQKLPRPSFPAQAMSTVIITPTQHLTSRFAPATHIPLLFAIQEAKESFVPMWQFVWAFTPAPPVNLVFPPASSPFPPPSHTPVRTLSHLLMCFPHSHQLSILSTFLKEVRLYYLTMGEYFFLCSPRDAHGHCRSGPQQVSPVEAELPCL